jgi:hypothetical protein
MGRNLGGATVRTLSDPHRVSEEDEAEEEQE